MKLIFTLFVVVFIATVNFSYAQCSVGGNGVATTTSIQINGDMADWSQILNDPDNYTYDASPDLDAPIADVGRDFTRFAMTENINNLFLYFSRAGSATNSVDIVFYLDVNNNGVMQTNESVIVISWSGSNGNTKVEIHNYIQSSVGGDVVSGDGSDMPGSLQFRVDLGNLGKGSTDGMSVELAIPFAELYKKGTNTSTDSLATGEHFQFHVSSINGSVASVPGVNSVNDNFGGCYSAFIVLPVRLVYFEGARNNNSVMLTWKVADNENASAFEIEQSNDGRQYRSIAVVSASKKRGNEIYSFSASLEYDKGYYRLKIIDDEKEAQYSKAIMIIRRESSGSNILKSNNPVYNDLIIHYEAASQSSARVSLYHSSGALIYAQTERFNKGSNLFIIPNNFLTIKGTYIVEVVNQSKERATLKALKL